MYSGSEVEFVLAVVDEGGDGEEDEGEDVYAVAEEGGEQFRKRRAGYEDLLEQVDATAEDENHGDDDIADCLSDLVPVDTTGWQILHHSLCEPIVRNVLTGLVEVLFDISHSCSL